MVIVETKAVGQFEKVGNKFEMVEKCRRILISLIHCIRFEMPAMTRDVSAGSIILLLSCFCLFVLEHYMRDLGSFRDVTIITVGFFLF